VGAVSDGEVHAMIEGRRLFGKGLGWVDAHLLASSLANGCQLWTLDRRLQSIADGVGAAT
jgi:hypothetical protein